MPIHFINNPPKCPPKVTKDTSDIKPEKTTGMTGDLYAKEHARDVRREENSTQYSDTDIATTLYNTVSLGQEELEKLAEEHKIFMAQCESHIADLRVLVNNKLEKVEEKSKETDEILKKAKEEECSRITKLIEEKSAQIDKLMASSSEMPMSKPKLKRTPAVVRSIEVPKKKDITRSDTLMAKATEKRWK